MQPLTLMSMLAAVVLNSAFHNDPTAYMCRGELLFKQFATIPVSKCVISPTWSYIYKVYLKTKRLCIQRVLTVPLMWMYMIHGCLVCMCRITVLLHCFIQDVCERLQITTGGQHVSLTVIYSLQIQCAGLQSRHKNSVSLPKN